MAKSIVLTARICDMLGFGGNLLTLTKSMEIAPHPTLLDDMVHIHSAELEEPCYLDRNYLLANELSLRGNVGKGSQILAWTRTEARHRNEDESKPAIDVLVVMDMFLLGETTEYKRFHQFLENLEILDSQAREFLARKSEQFAEMVTTKAGLHNILKCLANIRDSDKNQEMGRRVSAHTKLSLDQLAKKYSQAFVRVRKAEFLPAMLMTLAPESRQNVFKMLCHAEDQEGGAGSMLAFLKAVANATEDERIIELSSTIENSRDLHAALNAIRSFLLTPSN